MKLSDCVNYQDIVSAMSEIMEISNGAKRWNGKEVSDQSIYVPNTYDLKSGK